MKSPQIQTASYIHEDDKKNFSDLMILKSGAGYYLGTIFTDPVTGFQELGSRDTEYYSTREKAELALKSAKAGIELAWRWTP